MSKDLYGAIEAGGTKFICEVADDAGTVLAHTRIATTSPAATMASVLEFFAAHETEPGAYRGIGIAAFGPLDLQSHSPTFGHILATPKPRWSNTDLVGPLARRFGCEVSIDTDVNAAALAEARYGAGHGCNLVVYITVGTGIGGGIWVADCALRTARHPEMGHIRVLRHARDQDFAGICPFHRDCVEGLASGPAITARWGMPLDKITDAYGAREIISYYLGQLVTNVILLLSPERIIIGGGVMACAGLLPEIRHTTAALLNGYAGLGSSAAALETSIVPPGLGVRSGISGALALCLRTQQMRGPRANRD